MNILLAEGKRSAMARLRCSTVAGSTLVTRAQSTWLPPRGGDRARVSVSAGDVVDDWRVVKVHPDDEFGMTAVHLRHPSGAEYLHVDRNDLNNVFAVAFRTLPTDSTGVPHILEHTALCGSEKYPVRDPFFHMTRRSMNTFMNAFTGRDYTMYPFATQNATDFQNLMNVYVDAVFHPKLNALDFAQEGHRLELEDLSNLSSPLVAKGVVYNEMKGAMADPSAYFVQELMTRLFPGTPYVYNYGGDPQAIRALRHEDLVAFHRRNYTPAKAFFFSYGDLPMEDHLRLLNNLRLFDSVPSIASSSTIDTIPLTQRYQQPQSFRVSGPPEPANLSLSPSADLSLSTPMMKHSHSWLCNDTLTAPEETFSLEIAAALLLNGPTTPMYQALLGSGLAPEYSPDTGYDATTREASLSIGVQHVPDTEKEREKLDTAILSTLDTVSRNGFARADVENLLHQLELSLRHVQSFFGFSVLRRVSAFWMNGGDPTKPLEIGANLRDLRERVVDGGDARMLPGVVEKWTVENAHRVRMTYVGDPEHFRRAEERESETLREERECLGDPEIRAICDQAKALQAYQDAPQDTDCLPTLLVDDVPASLPYSVTAGVRTLSPSLLANVETTNGVSYLRQELDVSTLPADLRPFLPLFVAVFGQTGTAADDYIGFQRRVDACSGGLSVGLESLGALDDVFGHRTVVTLSTHFLERQTSASLSLLDELLGSARFSADVADRIALLLTQKYTSATQSLVEMGHQYARSVAAAELTPYYAERERIGGLRGVRALQGMMAGDPHALALSLAADAFPRILAYLQTSAPRRSILSLSSDAALDAAVRAGKSLLESPAAVLSPADACRREREKEREIDTDREIGSDIPAHLVRMGQAVYHTASVYRCVPYTHPDSPHLSLLSRLLTHTYLHPNIREKGGAYGGGATFDAIGGVFSMYSFRDPDGMRSNALFDQAAAVFLDSEVANLSLAAAKLEVFQGTDAPVTPAVRPLAAFAMGIDDDVRMRRREAFRSAEVEDLRRVAERYLRSGGEAVDGHPQRAKCIFGPETAEPPQQKTGEKWDVVDVNVGADA